MIRPVAACAIGAFGLAVGQAMAVECRDVSYDGNRYTVCEADAQSDDIRLFLKNDDGKPLGHFSTVATDLADKGLDLAFAMNAGMYHDDRSPVGYYVENGNEEAKIVSRAGPGNFGLLPNGVFCISPGSARVVETLTFLDAGLTCDFATQSGPMLVIDGELHPRFLPDSTSRYVRNGVGTDDEGHRVVFAISAQPVTFHEFGSLFRDGLDMPNALYFDGNISRLYAPEIGRKDPGFRLGPIVGIVKPEKGS